MSFGFGVGDFLAVTKLAWEVYTAYKDYKEAPDDFRNISDEIKSLHIIVDRHKDEFLNTTLNPDEAAQLREILQGCTNVLEDLDRLRIKYMSLGSAPGSSSQAIDRIKWSQENIAELRARLSSNTVLLTSFTASRTHAEINRTHADVVSGQAELLSSMEEMKSLFLNGLRRQNSTLSLRSMASFAPSLKTKEAMKQLCKNIYKSGIKADMIQNREDQVVALLQYPNTAPVATANQGEDLSQERHKSKPGNPPSGIRSTGLIPEAALHAAAAMGYKQGVKLLLASGVDIEVTRSKAYGAVGEGTPLDTAAHFGRIDIVTLLLEKGANIEATKSDHGSTPLNTAASLGHTDVARLLLEKGANIEATRSDNGSTPLDSAAFCGHTDVVRLLLEKGANLEATRSYGGATSLLAAAMFVQIAVVGLLLRKGANIHAATKRAATALHCVFYVPRSDYERKLKDSKQLIPTITIFLAHGANVFQYNDSGQTPLDLAEEGGHSEAKSLLLRHIKKHNLKPPVEV